LFVVSSFTQEQRPGIVLRPLAGFDTRLPLAAVWNRNHETPAVRTFLKALKSVQIENILEK
jgi:DNA-binding transcriptional LysR family regulator